jgi:hypothetical protein
MRTRLTPQRAPPCSLSKLAMPHGSTRPFARKTHQIVHSKYVVVWSPSKLYFLNPCFDLDTFDLEPRRHSSLEIRRLRFLPRRKQGPPSRRLPPPPSTLSLAAPHPWRGSRDFIPASGTRAGRAPLRSLHGRCRNDLCPYHRAGEGQGQWLWIAPRRQQPQ